jgi:hypothetical protein
MSPHRWFAGFFLLICMLAALFLNSVMFSARSFQHYVSQVAPETGGVIRLAEIEALGKDVRSLETTMAPLVSTAAEADAAAETLKRDLAKARDTLQTTQSAIMGSIDRLETEAGRAPPTPTVAYDEISLKARLDALTGTKGLSDSQRSAIPPVRRAIEEAKDTEEGASALAAKVAAANRDQSSAGEAVVRARAQIEQRQALYGKDFSRIAAEAEALKASSPLGIGRSFAEMHPVFLSTVLVCVMGALGAILYLFPLYMVPNAQVWFRDIVVRIVFGMATALAFYIVANATLAGFSLSSPTQQVQSVGSNLNPFTVSLLGIIAGIMATDIANWILERGRQMLGAAPGGGLSSSMAAPAPQTQNSAQTASVPAGRDAGQLVDPDTGRPI